MIIDAADANTKSSSHSSLLPGCDLEKRPVCTSRILISKSLSFAFEEGNASGQREYESLRSKAALQEAENTNRDDTCIS